MPNAYWRSRCSADPGDPQQLNRYSYVRNNPVRYNDPSGHCLGWLWGAPDCRLARATSELDVEGALDNVQTGLDVAGMIPVAGEALDLANAGISAARGNYGEAALSLAAMVPLAGEGASVGKLTLKYGDEAAAVLKHADEVVPAISKSGDEVAAAINAACSFSADTPVATTAGRVAIGDLRLGDHVLAWDEASGTTGSYTVTAVLAHPDPTLIHLTLDDEHLETTPEHPFLTAERGWVAAGDLRVGERVRQVDGGFGRVQAVALEQRAQVMYNLTVAVAHTFFVGEEGWLVHNTCEALANTAAAAHRGLPSRLQGSTVGASMGADGKPILAVYHRTGEGTEATVQQLRNRGWNVLDAPTGRGPDFHAERQLDAAGYTEIGISRQRGMCSACETYFENRPYVTVREYRRPQ